MPSLSSAPPIPDTREKEAEETETATKRIAIQEAKKQRSKEAKRIGQRRDV
jgi:hypothetical protein